MHIFWILSRMKNASLLKMLLMFVGFFILLCIPEILEQEEGFYFLFLMKSTEA